MQPSTDDVRIRAIHALPTPREVLEEFPCSDGAAATVASGRTAASDILHGRDDRLFIVVGPCSIHDPQSALEYAERLVTLRSKLHKTLEISMRVYFEKPRTTVGWKGLINDPHLTLTCINSALGWHRTGNMDGSSGILTSDFQIRPTPDRSNSVHHWTAMCLPLVEVVVARQIVVRAKVWCTTGPSIVDNPVNFIINSRD